MSDICIFCRLPKHNFNEEHVFAASIGGAFVISTVCQDCNTILGINIDEPFSKHEAVLVYRNSFNISRKDKRRQGNIPNPFKGRYKDDDGNDIYVEYNEDGKLVSNLLPTYKTHEVEGGLMVDVTLSLKDADEEKIKARVAKRFGLDPQTIVIVDKKIKQLRPPSTLNFFALNNPFILGCIKIAYEMAITFIPVYFNDPVSKVFATILLQKDINEYKRRFYEKDATLMEPLIKRFESIEGLQLHHHAVLLTSVPGKGLCCAVRIFNWIYTVCLSDREDYLNTDLVVINDSLRQVWWFNMSVVLSDFVITFDRTKLTAGQLSIIDQQREINFSGCGTPEGLLPIFNSEGLLLFSHIDGLAKDLVLKPEGVDLVNKRLCIPVIYNENQYFLKLTNSELYLPILAIGFIYHFK